MKKLRNWFLLIFLTFVFLTALVAVVELYCAYSYYRFRDTLKNDINAIRLREPIHNLNQGNFRTDSLGFILPYKPQHSTDKTIAFMGGSTTECLAVSEENRIHKVVEDELENVSCLNIGNSGNHSMHSLNLFVNKVAAYKPDVVVVNHNINDISILLNTGTYHNSNPSRSLLLTNSEELNTYKVGYPKNWFVRNFIPHISLVLLPTTFEGEPIAKREFDRSAIPDQKIADIENQFRNSILGLIRYIKSQDVKPILFTQGSCFKHYKIENEGNYKGYDIAKIHAKFNSVLREISNQENVMLVDAELLMKDNKEYFVDVVHYNDSGSLFISKYISEAVKSELAK